MVYGYSPFGYDGALITIETDTRKGIPSIDIIGLSDACVGASRFTIKNALESYGSEVLSTRILVSLSPCDVKKEDGFDFGIALSLLANVSENILAMGNLMNNGDLLPVNGLYPAATTAFSNGIKAVVCHSSQVNELASIKGLKVLGVKNLKEALEKIHVADNYVTMGGVDIPDDIEFPDGIECNLDEIKGMKNAKRAMAVALAGKLNILAYGAPGCGKTMLLQNMRMLTPRLTKGESEVVERIHSLAGLSNVKGLTEAPFREPHQTVSIEGLYGGGHHCMPGEISLAHNGILFLNEAAEFRSSCLQMLRVPVESHSITLSRAGRSTIYPADFQLAMTTSPCPCGNYGSPEKICLCSARAVEMYWKKISAPLLDRIHIKIRAEKSNEEDDISVDQMKEWIRNAYRIQRKRGNYNKNLTQSEIAGIELSSEAYHLLDRTIKERGLSTRITANVIETAFTIANMDSREYVYESDMKEALSYSLLDIGIDLK